MVKCGESESRVLGRMAMGCLSLSRGVRSSAAHKVGPRCHRLHRRLSPEGVPYQA